MSVSQTVSPIFIRNKKKMLEKKKKMFKLKKHPMGNVARALLLPFCVSFSKQQFYFSPPLSHTHTHNLSLSFSHLTRYALPDIIYSLLCDVRCIVGNTLPSPNTHTHAHAHAHTHTDTHTHTYHIVLKRERCLHAARALLA